MLYEPEWYDGEHELETLEECSEWSYYVNVSQRYFPWEVEEIVWEMWYGELISNDLTFEDWVRIVDTLLNGRWY